MTSCSKKCGFLPNFQANEVSSWVGWFYVQMNWNLQIGPPFYPDFIQSSFAQPKTGNSARIDFRKEEKLRSRNTRSLSDTQICSRRQRTKKVKVKQKLARKIRKWDRARFSSITRLAAPGSVPISLNFSPEFWTVFAFAFSRHDKRAMRNHFPILFPRMNWRSISATRE